VTFTVAFNVRHDQLDEDGDIAGPVMGGLSSAAWGDHGAGLKAEEEGLAGEFHKSMDGAAGAAVVLIEALGNTWAEVLVSIVGHANHNRRGRPGWSNDFLQVSVSVTCYR
jgi:hypothetical protein